MNSNFGLSGILRAPKSTVTGVVSAVVALCVAMGWIDSANADKLIALISLVILAIIGLLYKGRSPCLPPYPGADTSDPDAG